MISYAQDSDHGAGADEIFAAADGFHHVENPQVEARREAAAYVANLLKWIVKPDGGAERVALRAMAAAVILAEDGRTIARRADDIGVGRQRLHGLSERLAGRLGVPFIHGGLRTEEVAEACAERAREQWASSPPKKRKATSSSKLAADIPLHPSARVNAFQEAA